MKPRSEFDNAKEFLQQFAFKNPKKYIKKTKKTHQWHKNVFDCPICGMQIKDCVICNVLYCTGCDVYTKCK